MQMYRGLPIITNKIPENERHGIPHHLLDFIDLREKPWTVQHFVKESSRIIDEIRSRGRLPIVVGGTIYYTMSLLFEDAILTPVDLESSSKSNHEEPGDGKDEEFLILSAPTEEIHAKLREVDPEMAKRWHPNDRTKIRRSLEIYLRSGRKASVMYGEQQQSTSTENGNTMKRTAGNEEDATADREMSMRYPTLLLWLEAEDAILKQRLNDRVDIMVASGLCEEVLETASLEQGLQQRQEPVDLANGIWGSIGYKEMKPWLKARQTPTSDDVKVATVKQEGIEAVRASTRRYAKRQNRFVRIRLANAMEAAGRLDQLFLLDCTDLMQWHTAVRQPAEMLVTAFLSGNELPGADSLSKLAEKLFSQLGERNGETVRQARTCEVCNKILMTEKEWNGHLASRSHKKLVAWQRKQDLLPSKETERGRGVRISTVPD